MISEERKRKIVSTDLIVCFKSGKRQLTAEARFKGAKLPFPHLHVRIDYEGTEWADFGEYTWSTADSFLTMKEIGQVIYL